METNCGALTDPIREELSRLADIAYAHFAPKLTVKEAIRFCIKPQHRAVLKLATKLAIEGHRYDVRHMYSKLPCDTECIKDFVWHFSVPATHPDSVLSPRYTWNKRDAKPNPGVGKLLDKIYEPTLHAFDMISKIRVALHVFDTLNHAVADGRDIRHMRYYLDWLPYVLGRLKPSIQNEYNNLIGSKRRDRAEERRTAIAKYRALGDCYGQLQDTLAKYWWSLPAQVNKLIPIAGSAIAAMRILGEPKNEGSCELDISIPHFWNAATENLGFPDGFRNKFGFSSL